MLFEIAMFFLQHLKGQNLTSAVRVINSSALVFNIPIPDAWIQSCHLRQGKYRSQVFVQLLWFALTRGNANGLWTFLLQVMPWKSIHVSSILLFLFLFFWFGAWIFLLFRRFDFLYKVNFWWLNKTPHSLGKTACNTTICLKISTGCVHSLQRVERLINRHGLQKLCALSKKGNCRVCWLYCVQQCPLPSKIRGGDECSWIGYSNVTCNQAVLLPFCLGDEGKMTPDAFSHLPLVQNLDFFLIGRKTKDPLEPCIDWLQATSLTSGAIK